jgi:hypothetical protein
MKLSKSISGQRSETTASAANIQSSGEMRVRARSLAEPG